MFKFFKIILITASLFSSIQLFAHEEEGVVTIHMDESRFEPNNITIEAGTRVIFENVGKKPHWPASNIHPTHGIYPEFDSKGGVKPGEAWSFVFDKAGIWRMHDHIQAEISGVITVTGTSTENTNKEKKGILQKIKNFIISIFYFDNKDDDSIIKSLKYDKKIEKEDRGIWTDDNKLFSYLKKYGIKDTFIQLDYLSKQGFGNCHQRAHKAARISFDIYGSAGLKECPLFCHSGCYHGITEAYFKKNGANNIKEEINNFCSSLKNDLFSYYSCIHGIGHGLLSWTNYEVPEALEMCSLIKEDRADCFSGVFMENINTELAGEEKDEHITKYKSDDPQFPCTIVKEEYKRSCYLNQTSRMVQIFGADFKKISNECSKVPEKYREICFESLGRDISSFYRSAPDKSIKECNYSPKKYRTFCLEGAVKNYRIWDISGGDNSIKFCTLLTDSNEKKLCYNEIIKLLNLITNKEEEKDSFCSKVEKEFEAQCRL